MNHLNNAYHGNEVKVSDPNVGSNQDIKLEQ